MQDMFQTMPGGRLVNEEVLQEIALNNDVVTRPGAQPSGILSTLISVSRADRFLCLDIVDEMLSHHDSAQRSQVAHLIEILRAGRSAWTVAPDGRSLVTRVDATATDLFRRATTPADFASEELAEAWEKTYGRNPNASDAWDHAIKACEHALRSIVTPNNPTATLGGILGQLRAQPPQFELILRDNSPNPTVDPLATLEQILHLMWPNPDRHGSPDSRTPSQQEAEAVVQLAVTVVQWGRGDVLRKITKP